MKCSPLAAHDNILGIRKKQPRVTKTHNKSAKFEVFVFSSILISKRKNVISLLDESECNRLNLSNSEASHFCQFSGPRRQQAKAVTRGCYSRGCHKRGRELGKRKIWNCVLYFIWLLCDLLSIIKSSDNIIS